MDRALALVLDYPDDALLARRSEIAAALPSRLGLFVRWWVGADPRELRERYVADFDLRGGTALHLTYHRFGDRRDRGRALIALKRLLREAGWELDHWELPDYLPLLLELAAVDPAAGGPLLVEYRAEIEAIRRALAARESPWAEVVEAVTAELPPADEDDVSRLLDEGPPTELVGLEVRA
ncbi:MAG TPA: nitrate reductase molybdenum cofactor assembly chaperone [Gaiellaceae bacterium]|nr:nitrate reductase molybdenum cofactor assembly chaperone [Gaiellaceae bacterium]